MNKSALSLFQLNSLVRDAVRMGLPQRYWVRAELSEVRSNYTSGHCYLELIEKEARGGGVVAKARGMIRASVYRMLKLFFESETGQPFAAGIKVLVEVSADFHELYGYTLSIHNIDPTYTLGDMARQRAEVLRQLAEDGVIDMNKEVEWATLPQRIAVVSSPTAAGYGDFIDQLARNPRGLVFYPHLFPAIMQGTQAESSVIEALDSIYAQAHLFDAVVIIRGGGATSDLSCFDSYLLALNIAQFPLPIVTGIGHERDESVADRVANVRAKTPTAVAELLIERMSRAALYLEALQGEIQEQVTGLLEQQHRLLQQLTQQIPLLAQRRITEERVMLERAQHDLTRTLHYKIEQEKQSLAIVQSNIARAVPQQLAREQQRLLLLERTVELVSPFTLLQKGYTLTLKGGKVVKSSTELVEGETLTTLFADGAVESTVTSKNKN